MLCRCCFIFRGQVFLVRSRSLSLHSYVDRGAFTFSITHTYRPMPPFLSLRARVREALKTLAITFPPAMANACFSAERTSSSSSQGANLRRSVPSEREGKLCKKITPSLKLCVCLHKASVSVRGGEGVLVISFSSTLPLLPLKFLHKHPVFDRVRGNLFSFPFSIVWYAQEGGIFRE